MKKILLTTLLIISVLLLPVWAGAAVYTAYFADDGTDNIVGAWDDTECTVGDPCNTLAEAQAAIDDVLSTDTMTLYFARADTWTMNTDAVSTTSNYGLLIGNDDPIVNIDAYGTGAKPIFDGTVTDFSTAPTHNATTGPLKWNNIFYFQRDDCSVKNIHINDIYGNAIILGSDTYGTNSFTLEACDITGFGSHALTVAPNRASQNSTITKSLIHTGQQLSRYGLDGYGGGGYGAAVRFDSSPGTTTYPTGNTISYNVIYDIFGEGFNGTGTILEYNVWGDCASTAIYISPKSGTAQDTIARYNYIIFSSSGVYKTLGYHGIGIADEEDSGANGATVEVYGNTIINAEWGLYVENYSAHVDKWALIQIYNNTIIDSSGANLIIANKSIVDTGQGFIYNNASILYDRITSSHAQDWGNPADLDTYWTIDNNAYWTTGGSPTVDVDWDTNDVETDPKLLGEAVPVDWDGQSGATYFSDIDFDTHLYLDSTSGLIDTGKTLGAGYTGLFLTTGTDYGVLPATATFELLTQADHGAGWDIGAVIYRAGEDTPPVNNDCTGAIAHYILDANVEDNTVNDNDLTAVGSPTYPGGAGILLNGTTQHAYITNLSSDIADVSVFATFKFDLAFGDTINNPICGEWDYGDDELVFLLLLGDSLAAGDTDDVVRLNIAHTNGAAGEFLYLESTYALTPATEIYSVLATYDAVNDDAHIYIFDGDPDSVTFGDILNGATGETTAALLGVEVQSVEATPFLLGTVFNSDSAAQWYDGTIYEVAIYASEQTQANGAAFAISEYSDETAIEVTGMSTACANLTAAGTMTWAIGWDREPTTAGGAWTMTATFDYPVAAQTMSYVGKWNDQTGWTQVGATDVWYKTTYIEPTSVKADTNVLAEDPGATTGTGASKWDWAANVLYVNVGSDPDDDLITPSPWETYVAIDTLAGWRQDSFGDVQISANITLGDATIKDGQDNDATVVGALTGLATYPANTVAIPGSFYIAATGADAATYADLITAIGQLYPDDFIYFNRGETFREQVTVGSSGTEDHPIAYGAYGEGDKPIISGADVITSLSAVTYPAVVLATQAAHIIAYWKMDETSGGEFVDSGTLTNTADITGITLNSSTGIDGQPVPHWDGTGDYANLLPGDTDFGTDFDGDAGTACGWLKIAADEWVDGTNREMLRLRSTTGTNLLRFYKTTTDNTLQVSTTFDGTSKSISTTILNGSTDWFFWSITWDDANDRMRVYINGVELTGSPATGMGTWGGGALTGDNNNLGVDDISAQNNPFIGYMQHVAMWDTVLTPTEITALSKYGDQYVYSKSGITTEPEMVIYDGVVLVESNGSTTSVASGYWDWLANVLYLNVGENPSGGTVEIGQISWGIRGTSKDYITVDGIHFKYGNYGGIYDYMGDSWIIKNCTFTNLPVVGVLARGESGGADSITGIEMYGNTGAITSEALTGFDAILYCRACISAKIYQNTLVGMQYAVGIKTNDADDDGSGADSTSPEIYKNDISGGSGIVVIRTDNANIHHNHLHDGEGLGIAPTLYSDGAIIAYNLIHDMTQSIGDGLYNGIDINNDCQNGFAYNNTVYKVCGHCFTLEADTAECNGWTIKNNIFDSSQNEDSPGGHNASYYIMATSYTIDNNLSNIDEAFRLGLATASDLATWNATSGVGTDLEADPLFTTPGSDFTLQAESPAIDAGTNVGLTSDYAGQYVPIGAAPDIGAYEYGITTTLGLGNIDKYNLYTLYNVLYVPEGATGCVINDDSIRGTLDLAESVDVYNTWVTTVDLSGIGAGETVEFYNCAFIQSQATIEDQSIVASDSVTKANAKKSLVDGTAFIDIGVDLSAYAGSDAAVDHDYIFKLIDSAGKVAWGYVGASGGGETLGGAVFEDDCSADDTGDWSGKTRCTLTFDTDHYEVDYVDVNQRVGDNSEYSTSTGVLYKASADFKDGTASDETIEFAIGTAEYLREYGVVTFITTAAFATHLIYFTSDGAADSLGLWSAMSAGNYEFKNVIISPVTDCSTNGLHILSTKSGSVQNWAGIEAGFNYNNESGYTYEISIAGAVNFTDCLFEIATSNFLDYAGADFHLVRGSTLRDVGYDTGADIDLDGNVTPIGAAMDVGAYELRRSGGSMGMGMGMRGGFAPYRRKED